ncbi:MAG: hypothetical protein IT437_03925 [Phycisphaerales bacterium]|nr:hypothetical protein [Phycisphaerales bacterium]
MPNLARRRGDTWAAVGAGVSLPVYSLLVHKDRLYVGGSGIRAWDGKSFSVPGGGTNGAIFALGEWQGDLYAGGIFTTIGGVSAGNIARWNGAAWSSLGQGLSVATIQPAVHVIGTYAGNLVAGGDFSKAGTSTIENIARWDGSHWNGFASGLSGLDYGPVDAVCEYRGQLYAGGRFDYAPGVGLMRQIARWNGTQWEAVGAPTTAIAQTVHEMVVWNGELIAAGEFQSIGGGIPAQSIARWDGSRWASLAGGGVEWIVGAVVPRGSDLVVAGYIVSAGGQPAGHWAVYGCACYPDCNGDGALNLADFGCFTTKFALGDPYADCNGDGVRNLADFGCFTTRFALGCP